jgi:hypothetical protein
MKLNEEGNLLKVRRKIINCSFIERKTLPYQKLIADGSPWK